ncbi:hypothetical protein RJ55_03883 [Drechmeria coniospora]|nr:hypothetical protein RJ55_03883 [Drechmeria coniospora]
MAVASNSCAEAVPGSYIFEFEDGHRFDAFHKAVLEVGRVRLNITSGIMNACSVQIFDTKQSDKIAENIANLFTTIKTYSQVCRYRSLVPKAPSPGSNNDVRKRGLADGGVGGFPPHVMTQINKLHEQGFTGKGIIIAVIDSGIDYMHPALGGCIGDGCLVSSSADLVGNAYKKHNESSPASSDSDPMKQCDGHGTQVAGVLAARPNRLRFSGVVPDATLKAYRVVDCHGSGESDILMAAYNEAYNDGANIITASIGDSSSGWAQEPWAVVVQRIVEQGVPCISPAGNSGEAGPFHSDSAASGKGVTSVALIDNIWTPTIRFPVIYSIDGGKDIVVHAIAHWKKSEWKNETLEVYATSTNITVEDDACDPLPNSTPDLSNKIVLIRYGHCIVTDKITNAVAKGAKHVIIYNSYYGELIAYSSDKASVGTLARGLGETWIKAIKSGKRVAVKIPMLDKSEGRLLEALNFATPGALNRMSSWGPTWEMDLKPQVAAPGGKILTTYPRALGSYGVGTGTSLACPLVAGIVALIGQVRRTFNPVLINNLLSSTAKPQHFNDGTRYYDDYAPVAQQGGGLVQAYDAAFTTTLLEPSSLSFNDTDHFVKSLNMTISNVGETAVTYTLSNLPAITMYTLSEEGVNTFVFPNEIARAAASMNFSQHSVTLEAGHSASIQIEPTPPAGLNATRLALWSGWIVINGTDDSSHSIPYQGLTGSLRKATVLPPGSVKMALATNQLNYDIIAANVTNVTFTLPRPEIKNGTEVKLPALIAELAVGSPLLTAHIVPLRRCVGMNLTADRWGLESLGQPYRFKGKLRGSGETAHVWNGRLDSGLYAPECKYEFVVGALGIFGNASNRADWDVRETSPFEIKYS